MLLVVAAGFAWWRATASSAAPSREFTELELAAGDAASTGTCYSLSTVLIVNGALRDTARSWSAPSGSRGGEWTLLVENVRQGYNGPEREFRQFTFGRHGEQVQLITVDASKGHPTEVAATIDDLLQAPHARRSTPVDRCRQPNANGYQFPPK
jgi:hypothetical protein